MSSYSARDHLRQNVGQGNEGRMIDSWFNEVIVDGAKILEIGYGKGNFLKRVEDSGKKIELYGIDVSEENLKIAREQVGVKCGLLLMDISKEKFPWKENYFDAVIVMEVLEHIESPLSCSIEIQRVLKKNGLLLYSFPLEAEISGAKGPILNHKERKHESGFHSFPYPGLFMYENHRYFWNQQFYKIVDEQKIEYHMFWKMINTKLNLPHCLDVVNIDFSTEALFREIWTEPKYKDIY